MNTKVKNRLEAGKSRIARRLDRPRGDTGRPVMSGEGIRVEMADRVRAIGHGGIGLMHQLAVQSGLVDAINRRLHLLLIHRPYHESDHVLNFTPEAGVRTSRHRRPPTAPSCHRGQP